MNRHYRQWLADTLSGLADMLLGPLCSQCDYRARGPNSLHKHKRLEHAA